MNRFFKLLILEHPIITMIMLICSFEFLIYTMVIYIIWMLSYVAPFLFINVPILDVDIFDAGGDITWMIVSSSRYIFLIIVYEYILNNLHSGFIYKFTYLLRHNVLIKILFFLLYSLPIFLFWQVFIPPSLTFCEISKYTSTYFFDVSIYLAIYAYWYCQDIYLKWKKKDNLNKFKLRYVQTIRLIASINKKVNVSFCTLYKKISSFFKKIALKFETITILTVIVCCNGIFFYKIVGTLFYIYTQSHKYMFGFQPITVICYLYLFFAVVRFILLIKTFDFLAENGKSLLSKFLHYCKYTIVGKIILTLSCIVGFIVFNISKMSFLFFSLPGLFCISIQPVLLLLVYYWYLDRKYKDVV